ncbi:MAG: hypothetical protein R3B45_07475 [Bdellovibrionota bacterium]
MSTIVSKDDFAKALLELGHDPEQYSGRKLSVIKMSELYEIDQESILDAIESKALSAHYDYICDTIWVDALEAAHFYYCIGMDRDLQTRCVVA